MPIPLRSDFDAAQLRGLAWRTKDAPQARRRVALAAIYDRGTRTQAAAIGGVTPQIVRDWVVRFNAHGPDGLIDRKARAALGAQRHAPDGARDDDRERANPSCSRRRAVASD